MLALILIGMLTAQKSEAPGTFDDPNTAFHSAGVRGTIDAGGYAASAAAKTQSEFYRELADLQTSALRSAWTTCSNSDARRSAIDSLARGDFTGAVTRLEALLRTSDEAELHELLGLAYEGTGQLEAAAGQFRNAAQKHYDEVAIFAHGVALLFAGEVTQADSVFRQGSLIFSRLGIGAALFERGNVAQGMEAFVNAADANPDDSAPFRFLAIGLRSADPEISAHNLPILRSLTAKAPRNGYAHLALAVALAAQSAPPDQTMAELKQAVAFAPDLASAHLRLGELYAAQGATTLAIDEYRAVLASDPRSVEVHYRLGQLYMRLGQQSLAEKQFEEHKQARAEQKSEIESRRVPIRIHSCR